MGCAPTSVMPGPPGVPGVPGVPVMNMSIYTAYTQLPAGRRRRREVTNSLTLAFTESDIPVQSRYSSFRTTAIEIDPRMEVLLPSNIESIENIGPFYTVDLISMTGDECNVFKNRLEKTKLDNSIQLNTYCI
ncbi:hypothetical protein FO519_003824 [Halicephalobus sp. NKZ332]|nr:hypothetical protein FO519_003824 [Halicephalobus sp. NKZ332]